MVVENENSRPVGEWVDLAAEALGGKALGTSDDFFAGCERLLKGGRGVFKPGEYTERGKWMDGWESRRRRTPGHDWCIIELGTPGTISAVTIDTNHFLGNHPPFASVDGCCAPNATLEELKSVVKWTPLVAGVPLDRGQENWTPVDHGLSGAMTHVRLNIYPAGGVARFRVWGRPERPLGDSQVNLASLSHGAVAICCSDSFFSPMNHLLKCAPSTHMGDGWETRRSRPPGQDWVVIRLAQVGVIDEFLVDTAHFKGNYPDVVYFEGINWPSAPPWRLATDMAWHRLSDQVRLGAHREHRIESRSRKPISHVRMTIVPDGGVARLRIIGTPVPDSSLVVPARLAEINDESKATLAPSLARCCGSQRWVDAMIRARPFVSLDALYGEARRIWWTLDESDWREAFSHHPQIGSDIEALRAKFNATADWSEGEQSEIKHASEEILVRLASDNDTYLKRFGYIFIICATGQSADAMAVQLSQRLHHDPTVEIRNAAGEQAKITELRLEKLINERKNS
ncbi:MAG: allantoicase [Myxococcota bacterium]|nr:allantoicase [Myxococcota bacterium]